MSFVVSALLAWVIILTYEVIMLNKDNDQIWEIILSLAKSLKQNIEMFEDDNEDDEE